MNQRLPISGPLGLGDVLDGAFRLYRAHFVKLLLTAALFLAPVGVLSLLLLGAASGSFFELFIAGLDQPLESEAPLQALSLVGSFVVVIFAGYIATALAFLSLTVQGDLLLAGREAGVGELVRRGFGRLAAFVGMVLGAGFVIFGLVLLTYFIFGVGLALIAGFFGFLAFAVGGNDLLMVGAFILLMLFSLGIFALAMTPVVVLAARWLAAPTLVASEQLGPIGALRRSWQLTRGHFWRALGYIILLTLLNTIVFSLPLGLLQTLVLVLLTPQLMGLMSGVMAGMGYFFSILWYPFLALVLLLITYDLRVRGENFDLELRILAIEESLRPGTLPE